MLRERSLVVECWSPKPAVKVRFLPLLPEICRHRLVGLGRQVLILEIRGSNPLGGTLFCCGLCLSGLSVCFSSKKRRVWIIEWGGLWSRCFWRWRSIFSLGFLKMCRGFSDGNRGFLKDTLYGENHLFSRSTRGGGA